MLSTKKEATKAEAKTSKAAKPASPLSNASVQSRANFSAATKAAPVATAQKSLVTSPKASPTASVPSQGSAVKLSVPTTQSLAGAEKKKNPKTKITIKYDVGFSNQLFIRGKGATLSWDKGQPLKNVKPDEWVWETDASFTSCEFKVLINDTCYECGTNHTLSMGATIVYTPSFG